MKKVVVSILCIVLLMASFAFAAEVYEKPDFSILVNGVAVDKTDVPIVIEGRTLVPLRTLAVALGVPNDDDHIIWNGETREVTVINDSVSIELTIDSAAAVVNGENKTIDVSATIYNGRTYLPARFIAEAFDKEVGWNAATSTVTIDDKVEGEDASVILEKSEEAMEDIKSLKADLDMDMDVSVQGMPMSIDMNGPVSIDMNKKQIYSELDMNISILGMPMPMEMYMYMDNDKAYTRTVEDGEDSGWIEEESATSIEEIWAMVDGSQQLEVNEEFYDSFEILGTEGVYTIVAAKDNMAEVIESTIKNTLDSAGNEAVDLGEAEYKITKAEYKMYINNSTKYTDKIEMNIVMDATTEGQTINMSISVTMNMSEFNKVKITKPNI